MMTIYTYDEIIAHKHINERERLNDIQKLKKWKPTNEKRSFCGNKFIYHYQLVNMGKVRINNKDSLHDVLNDPIKYEKLWGNMMKLNRTGTIPNRLYEANRFNSCVAIFKATTAKWVYEKYGATSVLDPTAGWGGRMLGAHSLGIRYVGFDTNTNMKPAYDGMMSFIKDDNLKMRFENSLTADFSSEDYDFVLTSPPYLNIETYENMTPFESRDHFYNDFLIPLIDKCLKHIKKGGKVAFNISPKMYYDLTMIYKYRVADFTECLLQQKRLGVDKQDLIYIWTA